MNRNRLAAIVVGSALLSALTACTERTKENMVPTGEVVEVEVEVNDTLPPSDTQAIHVEPFSIDDAQ